jgi:transaldolase
MKIFIDSAEVEKIRKFAQLGLVDGVTTNPTLILKAGKNQEEVIKQICEIVKGPVSAEGIADKAEDIVKEGEIFSSWAPNVVVKVALTLEGLKAVKMLSEIGIRTNVTLVFSANQALLAAKAGADFVSPFVGRLEDNGENGIAVVKDILQIYKNYGFSTQVIVASVRNENHVLEAAKIGAHIATVPPQVLENMFKHKLTDAGIKKFKEDWEAAKKLNIQ